MNPFKINTPVITTFYAKSNVFGFVVSNPKKTNYMEDGQTIEEIHYEIELSDGSILKVQDIHLEEVNPDDDLPEDYELSYIQRTNKQKIKENDEKTVSYIVSFTSTDGRSEVKYFDGMKKVVRKQVSDYAEVKGYNSYSTSTNTDETSSF